jgi:RNA polymerase sigma-70 factor (ECF subfamily)
MKTSKSMLIRARENPDSEAWFKIISIYDPLIAGWLRRSGVSGAEVSDITQDVLYAVSQELHRFEHNGRTGAFRNWLKTITVFRCRRHWEKQKNTVPMADTTGLDLVLRELEDPNSDLSQQWDREHDSFVLDRILKMIEPEFEPRVMEVFRRSAVGGETAKAISTDLDISTGQVYKYKFRVMQRLHEEAKGLIDKGDDPFA